MHIPDGYLSPYTAAAMYGASLPFWYHSSSRVKKLLSGRAMPLIAIFAAFSFTIQMFNIPVPGGTTAHAVGSVLMAIVLGPWAAVIGVSTALVIQALFFGDGGITAIGANCFNMAIAMPLSGYAAYRALASSNASPRRKAIAAAIGGYVGINIAGFLTGLELGVQPLLWSENGRALYSPYGLETTIPTMAFVHLTVAGFAEAAITGLAIAYLQRVHPTLFTRTSDAVVAAGQSLGKVGWTLVGLLTALVILTPIGLLAPGRAEFEWSADELKDTVGYVPIGLAELEGLWQMAPFPGYQLDAGSQAGFIGQAIGYASSAIIGVAILLSLFVALRLFFAWRTRPGGQR